MLPGLRFLFAATLIAASLLVFGMGAIALMRASHQQFASLPPRPAPEPVFAEAPQTVPSLSMLRVETAPAATPPAEESAPERFASLTSSERTSEPVAPPVMDEPKISEKAPTQDTLTRDDKSSQPDTPAQDIANAPIEAIAPETEPATPPTPAAAAPDMVSPEATGSIAMPEDQPATEQPAANPPLPEARPEIAAVTPAVLPAPAKAKPKPVVKRKVRRIKRHRPKAEKLPAVSSAPTLGSLFGGSKSN